MRLLLPTLLAVLVVMTNGLVVPNDKSVEMIRRSPDEKNIQTKSVEEKCYLDGDFCGRTTLVGRFRPVWAFSNVQRYSTVGGVFPNFAGSFSSLNGWEDFAAAVAAITNSVNTYGDYFGQNQLSINTVQNSLYNFISSFQTLAQGCYNGYPRWGSITSYQSTIGPLYAQCWEAINGFLGAGSSRFSFDRLLPTSSVYYSRFYNSVDQFTRIQPFSTFGPYFTNRHIDIPFFQSHNFRLNHLSSYSTQRGLYRWGGLSGRIR